jgi:hypothetical protein
MEFMISRYSNIPIDIWRYIINFVNDFKVIGNNIICLTPIYNIRKKIVDANNGYISLQINDDKEYYIYYYEPTVIRWRNDATDDPRFRPSRGILKYGVKSTFSKIKEEARKIEEV